MAAPVDGEIATRLPRTLELIVAAAIIAVVLGIPSGMVAGLRPRGLIDDLGAVLSASRSPCRCSCSARCWC